MAETSDHLFCHLGHRGAGTVPVNWLWFLGYGSFILSHMGQSVAAVFLYAGIGGHVQD